MIKRLTTQERIAWLEQNNPDLYIALQNWRCVEDGDITEWLDSNDVPRGVTE